MLANFTAAPSAALSGSGLGINSGAVMLAGCFLVTFALFGTTYAFAAFFPAICAEFSVGRGGASVAFGIAGFLCYSLGAVSGALADRFGTARLVAAGMAAAAVGLLIGAGAESLGVVQAALGLGMGVGAGLAFVPTLRAAQARWPRNQGLAAGVTAAGSAAGTIVVPLAAGWLIHGLAWRGACVVMAAALLVAGAVTAAVLSQSAASGAADTPKSARSWRLTGALTEARQAPAFRLIYLGAVCASVGAFMPFVHLPAFARDLGVGEGEALALVGNIGIGGLAGRLIFGVLADRLGYRACFGGVAGGMMLALTWWGWTADSYWELVGFALAFGALYGGYVVLLPVLAAAYLPGPNLGGVIGLMLTSHGVGLLIGPAAAGAVYDITGGYGPAILSAAALNIVPIACALRINRPPGDADNRGVIASRAP
jgi:MFS family permease